MKDLIEALQIFLKYGDVTYPTHCEHDELLVWGYDPSEFSEEDLKRLDHLGFSTSDEFGDPCFRSYRYGSC